MNKKYNIIIAVLLIVIIILVAIKFKPKDEVTIVPEEIGVQSTIFDWKSLSSSDVFKIASKIPDLQFYPEVPIELSAVADLTGDGIPEGVFTGDGGNNGLSIILSKTNESGTITLLQQKDQYGTVGPVTLLSVGRAMINEGYQLLPEEHGFYTVSRSYDPDGDYFICNESGVNAYIWNSSTKLFEWNKSYSEKYTSEACK